MEKKFTFHARTVACTVLTITALIFNSFTAKTFAQLTCQSETVLFSETFGTGTTATSSADIVSGALTFQASGMLVGEGVYRVIDSTQQKPEWQVSGDHTGNANGKMLVINGIADTFYSHRLDGPNGFRPATYIASMFLMNLDVTGTCSLNPLLPAISIRLEYLAEDNTWQPLTGSPYAAPGVAQSASPTWVPIGSTFILPSTGSFLVKSMRVLLENRTAGGCGNDFALDDIKISLCPNGALPVEFLGITARQKGSGVSVEWATAQETNTKSFVVEKSADGGNANWDAIATISAAGNSSVAKNYNAYDSKPFNGVNFYRIRQVDKDGNFKYSKIVSLKVNFGKTGITVLTNPFHNSLTVDFSSAGAQVVSAKLLDITGKQVALEKWSINSGTTRKEFSNVSGLQQGMYIFTVSGANGEILYNNKVIKQ